MYVCIRIRQRYTQINSRKSFHTRTCTVRNSMKQNKPKQAKNITRPYTFGESTVINCNSCTGDTLPEGYKQKISTCGHALTAATAAGPVSPDVSTKIFA